MRAERHTQTGLCASVRIACLCVLYGTIAATLHATGYLGIPLTDREPRIDGLVTPRERAVCSVTTFTALGKLSLPKHQTTLYSCATRKGLYLGFVCEDPDPSALVTSVTTENGPVMKDDSVEIVLAPALVAERDNYFHFAVNAIGVKYSWDAQLDRPVSGWLAKAGPTPAGWEAEFFIPFAAVRGRHTLSHWRGNFQRNRPARRGEKPETSVWFDPGLTIHNYKKFGFLRFEQPKEEDLGALIEQLMQLRQQEPALESSPSRDTIVPSMSTTQTTAP